MSTNDTALDSKILPIGEGGPNGKHKLTKAELTDILGGCEIAPADEVDLSDDRKFTKLELTEGQRMQMSGLMNQLPALFGEGVLSKAVSLTFPKGVQGALMNLKTGGCSTTLLDEAGKIVGTASMNFLTPQAVVLGAFTAMSIASGQYFLAQINNRLGQISSKLDKILEFLYGDKRAELLSEVNFIRFAYENYKSVMENREQRIATLVNLQSAKKVAMKDIEFYLSDLESDLKSVKKRGSNISWTVSKMIRTQEELLDLSLQLYTMSNLLEIYYSENYDPKYICFVKGEASQYIRMCANRALLYFGKLQELLPKVTKWSNPGDKWKYTQQVDDIVAALAANITSSLQAELKSALSETSKQKQYYLNQDGEVYLVKAS